MQDFLVKWEKSRTFAVVKHLTLFTLIPLLLLLAAFDGGRREQIRGAVLLIPDAVAIMFNDMMYPNNSAVHGQKRKNAIEKDGKLSFQESLAWWSVGNGETVEVDVNSLNLDFIDVSNKEVGSVWCVDVEPGGQHQWGVYGTLTVGYVGNHELVVFPDKYDFDIKPNPTKNPIVNSRNRWTRIDKAIHGSGTPYYVVFKGKYKLKSDQEVGSPNHSLASL